MIFQVSMGLTKKSEVSHFIFNHFHILSAVFFVFFCGSILHTSTYSLGLRDLRAWGRGRGR